MIMPKETLWPLKPHTRAKHEVLKHYLEAWFPVLGSRNGRILFIDGFAGPGKYAGGEPGSPIIALDALRKHKARNLISAEIGFVFIEQDKQRADHLGKLCDSLRGDLPDKCWVRVIHGAFDSEMSDVLDNLDEQKKKLAPTLVMVDPFGVSGLPMQVLQRILQNSRCELYVSFMYEGINRFISQEEFEPHLDMLFGSGQWREGIDLTGLQRKRFLYGLYRSQLKKAGPGYVVHFDLYEGKRLIYAIFFATKSSKGCDLMKHAIWKVAPFGDYAFRGTHSAQLSLGLSSVDLTQLQEAIAARFRNKDWVSVETVKNFVASDECDYHTGHMKKALRAMEEVELLEVDAASRTRRFTFPAGTRIRISD